MRTIALLLLAASLTACTGLKPYQRPAVNLPTQWQAGASAAPVIHADAWWAIFADRELERLLTLALHANPDVQIAKRRLRVAADGILIARSQYWPQVSFGAAPVNTAAATGNHRTGLYSMGFSATYELDLWGRVGDEVVAATAEQHATAGDLAALRISLQRQVAGRYFALCALDGQQAVQVQRIALAQQSLALTQLRASAGRIDSLPVEQAQATVTSAIAEQVQQQAERSTAVIELALLLGQTTESLQLPTSLRLAGEKMPTVPAALPASLLEQRPDLWAAEQRLRAADADVAATRAAVLPQLGVQAELGIVTGTLDDFIQSSSKLVGIGPTLNYVLFDGGHDAAEIDAHVQARAIAVIEYRKAVLAAVADVELAQLARSAAAAAASQLAQRQAATAKQRLASDARLAAGRGTRFEQLALQAVALDHQAAIIDNIRDQLDSLLGLYAALGGGWSAAEIASSLIDTPVAPPSLKP